MNLNISYWHLNSDSLSSFEGSTSTFNPTNNHLTPHSNTNQGNHKSNGSNPGVSNPEGSDNNDNNSQSTKSNSSPETVSSEKSPEVMEDSTYRKLIYYLSKST